MHSDGIWSRLRRGSRQIRNGGFAGGGRDDTHPKGYVEKLGDGRVEGWVAWSGVEPVVTVQIGETMFPVHPTWQRREDVTSAHPEGGPTPGFVLSLPEPVWAAMAQAPADAVTAVLADGKKLDLSGNLAQALTGALDAGRTPGQNGTGAGRRSDAVQHSLRLAMPVRAPVQSKASAGNALVGVVQVGLALRVESPGDGSALMARLEAGDQSFDLHLAVFPDGDKPVGHIDLPPFVWDAGGDCRIRLWMPGEVIPREVVLDPAEAYRHLEWLVSTGEEKQAEILLGIEHARYLVKRMAFSENVTSGLLAKAEIFGCVAYLTEFFPRRAIPESAVSGPAKMRSAYFQAFQDFTIQVETWPGNKRDLLAKVGTAHRLSPAEQQYLLESFVGYFCQHDIFDQISFVLDDARVQEMAQSRDAWQATAALPFLAAKGQVRETTELVRALVGRTGWLSTECLLEVARRISGMTFPMGEKSGFFYALSELIASLHRDYWSRAHDRNLVRAFALWFDKLPDYPDWMARDLVASGLRFYGLSGDFWEAIEASGALEHANATGLRRGRDQFLAIRAVRDAPGDREVFLRGLTAAQFFVARSNEDAVSALREFATAALTWFPQDPALRGMIDTLLDSTDPTLVIRLAAHPAAQEGWSSLTPPEMADLLRQEINKDSFGSRSTSAYSLLEERAGQSLRALWPDADNAAGDSADARETVIHAARALNTPETGFLCADVLMTAHAQLSARGIAAGEFIQAADQAIAGIARTDPAGLLRPAVTTALARLSREGMSRFSRRDARSPVVELGALVPPGTVTGPILKTINEALQGPPEAAVLKSGASDTLVVIYSCRKYLEDRIPVIRATWVQDLVARGIPYVVLVGDGTDVLNGDVLELDVEDTYEALPAKTLKMVDWVFRNTDFQYLIKIDDDCCLSVDRYFDSLSYRKFHYYGKILNRPATSMDRSWHQGKSRSMSARNRLDRSPTPSRYCDGGGGYSLSRHAMHELCGAAASERGAWLRNVSFMEDKLVGDLLAIRGIFPSNENYAVHTLRKTHPEAHPVVQNDNTFSLSACSPTRIVHLDTHLLTAEVYAQKDAAGLTPRKVWSSYRPLSLEWNTNQLQLLDSAADPARLGDAGIIVVAVMRNEMTLLPHFLNHYRKIGVESFIIVDNLSDDGTREYLQAQADVVVYSVDTEYRASHFGVAWQQAVLANHCLGKWCVLVDADEFLVLPEGAATLADHLAEVGSAGYDCIGTWLVDMYPKGKLSDCDFRKVAPFAVANWHDEPPVQKVAGSGQFSNTGFSVNSTLRHRLIPDTLPTLFTANKHPLLRYAPWMRLSEGIHYVGNTRIAPDYLTLAHFKYHAGFAEKVEKEILRKQHFGGAVEYQKYRGMVAEGQGNFYRKGVSTRLDGSRYL